ncbi:hypothetical protein D3C81_1757600 [compost metagenome]
MGDVPRIDDDDGRAVGSDDPGENLCDGAYAPVQSSGSCQNVCHIGSNQRRTGWHERRFRFFRRGISANGHVAGGAEPRSALRFGEGMDAGREAAVERGEGHPSGTILPPGRMRVLAKAAAKAETGNHLCRPIGERHGLYD